MSGTKAALKAAKVAIDQERFQDAVEESKTVLSTDPSNYHAHVFRGLAFDKLNKCDESEKSYRAALGTNDGDTLAWQGLASLYEKLKGSRLDLYHEVALRLAECYMKQDEREKAQIAVDKYTKDAKRFGSRGQYRRSLELLLPDSSIYDFLEGRIPHPSHTYSRLIELIEFEEKERINVEIGQRRTRLGARLEQVKNDVRLEVLQQSPLEELYAKAINWTQDDEKRYDYEEKQLQRAGDLLTVLPVAEKSAKREEVMKLARGFVILQRPFLLAWKIWIEWQDPAEMKEIDVSILASFVKLFPEEGLAKVIRGYFSLALNNSPFLLDVGPRTETFENEGNDPKDGPSETPPLDTQDIVTMVSDGFEDASQSILAHKLVGQFYLYLEEYESVALAARAGLERLKIEAALTALPFRNAQMILDCILGTALIYHQAPRHHEEARLLFQTSLQIQPTYLPALHGIGLVYEEDADYAQALSFLDDALRHSQATPLKAEAAWCRYLTGQFDVAFDELSECLSLLDPQDAQTKSLASQIFYRIGMCLWTKDSSRKSRKDRTQSYTRFLHAVQMDMQNAPAYTMLGIYYADMAHDKKRARKCFQKALEISSSELEAGYRLANSFAIAKDWDLVEVVAQRVIDSGKTRPSPGSKKQPINWPYAALGVVQLSQQEHARAIVSFQSALRYAPEDFHSWIGLGEAYHKSGRYIAATRAFEQALHTSSRVEKPENVWYGRYMLANVKREIGSYDEAIEIYETVAKSRDPDFGVLLALVQCRVEYAHRCLASGCFGKAAELARKAIMVAHEAFTLRSQSFNLWRALSDACIIFCMAPLHVTKLPIDEINSMLDQHSSQGKSSEGIIKANKDASKDSGNNLIHGLEDRSVDSCLSGAIAASKAAISIVADDLHAQAVGWFNLGLVEYYASQISKGQGVGARPQESTNSPSEAVVCFKKAIELESGNADFWNALGIAVSSLSPRVAQHSFVRALYLNDRDAKVWTNLGVLYAQQNDLELAREAFTKAQSADPDYALAWYGQGMLLDLQKVSSAEAQQLFTHAFEISNDCNAAIGMRFGLVSFDLDHSEVQDSRGHDLLRPLMAVDQVCAQDPRHRLARHLSALLAERLENFDYAAENLEIVCAELESEFESSESSVDLVRFAQAKADLARVYLSLDRSQAAIESAETALALSEEGIRGSATGQRLRLSALITAGLAHHRLLDLAPAIEMFKTALSESDSNPDLVCLLSQVLWATGGHDEQEIAKEQLLACLENESGHFDTIAMLTCIALSQNDVGVLQVVGPDLQQLRTQDHLDFRRRRTLDQLLMAITLRSHETESSDMAQIGEATTSLMTTPWHPAGWTQLSTLTSDNTVPAEAAILTGRRSVPPRGSLDALGLASALAASCQIRDAQIAIMTAPSSKIGWKAILNA